MAEPQIQGRPRMPRWAKVLGVILAVVVTVFFLRLFTAGPMRGPMPPGHHMSIGGGDRAW